MALVLRGPPSSAEQLLAEVIFAVDAATGGGCDGDVLVPAAGSALVGCLVLMAHILQSNGKGCCCCDVAALAAANTCFQSDLK